MNRRDVIQTLSLALMGMFAGVLPTKRGKASPEAIRLAKNGIISPKRTPWMLGGKVFVDGKEMTHVRFANVSKGYVVRYLGPHPRRTASDLQTERVYRYVHAELKEGVELYQWGSWPESEVDPLDQAASEVFRRFAEHEDQQWSKPNA